MAPHTDILIIGGGVIGLTTAWYLAGEGVSVTIVDQGEMGKQSSWAGAGIIPPGDLKHARTPIERLRAHSVALYPDLSAHLRESTGIDNGYVRCGGIELLDPEADSSTLPTEEWHNEGVVCEPLSSDALLQHEPLLAKDLHGGVWIPGMAQVRNPWHLHALQKGCERRGVHLLASWPAERLVTEGNKVRAVEGPAGRLDADQFLVCAGAWTSQILGPVGCAPAIRPIRGQMALFNTGRVGVRPILLQGKRYLVPRGDGRVLAGSTEEDVGFDARPTGGGIAGLIAFAIRLVPALADATLETCWAGLRPGSPDALPYLGPVPGWQNLHLAAGHFRAGLQLSPATGLVMAQYLRGVPTIVPLDDFRVDRASL
jgi:glycine oxidase